MLAVTGRGRRRGPQPREVARQLQDMVFLVGRYGAQRLTLEAGELGFQLRQPLHRVVPALLERGGDQPVGGIDRLVASLGEIGLVACPLDPPRQCAPMA